MNTIEYIIEDCFIKLLEPEVPTMKWLHFENETTDKDGKAIGVIKAERVSRTTLCFYNFDISIYVVGAKDEYHRKIDNTVGDKDRLAIDLEEKSNGLILVGTTQGWNVPRSTVGQNLYSRTWTTTLEAGYSTNN